MGFLIFSLFYFILYLVIQVPRFIVQFIAYDLNLLVFWVIIPVSVLNFNPIFLKCITIGCGIDSSLNISSTSNFNLFNQMFCLLKNEHLQCLDFDYLSILRVKNSNSKKNKFKLISLLNFFIHFFSLYRIFTISRKIPSFLLHGIMFH